MMYPVGRSSARMYDSALQRRSVSVDGLPLVRSNVLVRSFPKPPGKVYLLYGSRLVFHLSLTMAAHAIAHGSRLAVVDGGNEFNVHLLSQFARQRKLNTHQFLERIFVSRGFTCYQMEQAIVYRLPEFLARIGSNTAMIFGLLETFYDDQVRTHEANQILQRLLAAMHRMKDEGTSLLVACEDRTVWPEERNRLFATLKEGVDRIYLLDAPDNSPPRLFLEKGGTDDGTHRTHLYEHHRPGAGKLVEVPPRITQRGSGTVR